MPRFGKARDANERAIVDALVAAGWSVERIEPVGRNSGLPDLVLGKAGYTTLAEVKREAGPQGGRKDRRLTDNQEAWHAAWKGARPLVLDCGPAEAVARCADWLGGELAGMCPGCDEVVAGAIARCPGALAEVCGCCDTCRLGCYGMAR